MSTLEDSRPSYPRVSALTLLVLVALMAVLLRHCGQLR